jgi:hypothetical protein
MESAPQLPVSGSWKTRATRPARAAVPWRVTSEVPIFTWPSVAITSPASTPSSVDLPAPFEPMTVTNWPSSMVRLTPLSACFCNGVPLPKVTLISETEIIRRFLRDEGAAARAPR